MFYHYNLSHIVFEFFPYSYHEVYAQPILTNMIEAQQEEKLRGASLRLIKK